jgi:diguanylate cyclase (GGDEF)-like protein
MKILIVDDSPLNIDVLVSYLEKEYELLIALDGNSAIDILDNETPELILMDIIMPTMDGFETTKKIKKNPKLSKIPIIFLTADNDSNNLKNAFDVGGVDFIHKPIIYSELKARVKTHLELSNYRQNLEDIILKQTQEIEHKNYILLQKLYFDENTGLKNMLSFQKDIKDLKEGNILLLDIDNFNTINKLYGFSFGDDVLKIVGNILDSEFKSVDSVYKITSDRYILFVKDSLKTTAQTLCEDIFSYFDTKSIKVDNIDIKLSFSIGISKIKQNEESMVEAEFSLDLAKKMGKRFRFFYGDDSDFIKIEKDNLLWLNKTRQYIEKKMIEPFYQPIVDAKTKKVFKYEALARVIDDGEIITPEKFLIAAKKLGYLTDITRIMIDKVCENFANTDIKFSINITQRDLVEDYLHNYIFEACENNFINPTNITVELLENVTLSNENDEIIENLKKIKKIGCKVAIDDFGSENSNFSRIISLKSDYLKIDGLFIQNIDSDEEKKKIIAAIVGLARKLEIKTIAEYVSDENVFETLAFLGVDYLQGYYFGKPQQQIDKVYIQSMEI